MTLRSTILLAAALVAGPALFAQGPEPAAEGQSLSLQEVVRMAQAGLTEELIVARVKRNAKPFDLNSAEIVALKESGVSEVVLRYLIDPAAPYTPAPPPAPPAAAAPAASPVSAAVAPPPSPAKPPSDPLVLKLPPESGLYWFQNGKPVQLELKTLVTSKAGGKSKLLLGLKKGHIVGSLAGSAAKSILPAAGTNLYARVQTPVEDIMLVQLEPEDGRRDLDFGTKADKPAFPPQSVHPFESKDVGQGVIRLTLPLLGQGEYILLILGSGEEKKGTLGKGWEFSAQ